MIDDLPPLREVIRTFGLDARKALGQNFLFDLNLTSKIARSAGPLEGHVVVEVGPGPGGLTRALLAHGADEVIAIERDARCLPALAQIAEAYPGRLTVIEGDALEVDVVTRLAGRPAKIVANLPYNVGTALLIGWLRQSWPPFYASMTLMFQREVAERIVATPDMPSDYGRLGILAGWRTKAKILFDVPPSAFTPAPKITSSIVSLVPRGEITPARLETLERITAAAFAQRRKMIRQSLKGIGDTAALFAAAGLEGSERPETIPVSGFLALANALDALQVPSSTARSR